MTTNEGDAPARPEGIHVGGPARDTRVRLCLYAPDIDVESITAAVGCKPTRAQRRGEILDGRPPARVGLWSLDAPESLRFEDKVKHLLECTTPEQSVWDDLGAQYDIQLRCTIFLHAWNEGIDLPSEVVAELGRRHWSFGMSMYSAEGEEIFHAFLSGQKTPIPPKSM